MPIVRNYHERGEMIYRTEGARITRHIRPHPRLRGLYVTEYRDESGYRVEAATPAVMDDFGNLITVRPTPTVISLRDGAGILEAHTFASPAAA